MLNENHIINKQVFEFTCSQAGHAFELQKQMESGMQYRIQSGINGLLNELDEICEIIRIEKMEIDLGEISFDKLEELLPGKIYAGFSDKLRNAVITDKPVSEIIKKNNDQHKIKLLEIFLLTGSIPWQACTVKDFSLVETIQSLIKNNPDNLKALLLKNIFNQHFIERLCYQTTVDMLKQLISLFPAFLQFRVLLEDIFSYALPVLPVSENKGRVDLEIISNIFFSALQNQVSINEENVGHADNLHLKTHYQAANGSANETSGTRDQNQSHNDLSKNILRLVLELIASNPLPDSEEQMKFLLTGKIIEAFGNSIEIDLLNESINEVISINFNSLKELIQKQISEIGESEDKLYGNDSIIETNEKIYIQNAGLVLMATFLPALFKELQWTDGGKFINRQLQLKALFLLHYICTGDVAAPEYTLQLNKILCGFHMEEPIPFTAVLTDAEKQEAEQLLTDIIGHWAALKNSSVEALRGSFLLRDALLSYKNDHWLLQVERKGYDTLLDHIPWSWQTIKFDWMKNYIEVEW